MYRARSKIDWSTLPLLDISIAVTGSAGEPVLQIRPEGLIAGMRPVIEQSWEGLRSYAFETGGERFQIFVARSTEGSRRIEALFLRSGETVIASIKTSGAARRALILGGETLSIEQVSGNSKAYTIDRSGHELLAATFLSIWRRNYLEISSHPDLPLSVALFVAFALLTGGIGGS